MSSQPTNPNSPSATNTNSTLSGGSPPPPPPRGLDIADLLGWSMKYILIPLVPFFIGAGIRLLENGTWAWTALEPAELAFSLAMLCLLGNVSARQLNKSDYRDAIAGIFTIGAVIFISMFAYAVSQSARLNNIRQFAISQTLAEASRKQSLTEQELIAIAQFQVIASIETKLSIVLVVVFIMGLIYIVIGLGCRHVYGIGDEQ